MKYSDYQSWIIVNKELLIILLDQNERLYRNGGKIEDTDFVKWHTSL